MPTIKTPTIKVEKTDNDMIKSSKRNKSLKEVKSSQEVKSSKGNKSLKEVKSSDEIKLSDNVKSSEEIKLSDNVKLSDDVKSSKGNKSSCRMVVTPDTLFESFHDLVKYIEDAIIELREDKSKTNGIKFLRSLNKDVKAIRDQTQRVLKQSSKKPKKVSTGSTSGFLKPVAVSSDLCKFAGWTEGELHSRVDVTKYICQYIKNHDLQDPADRRCIHPDSKLNKLLGLKGSTKGGDDPPLRYYSLQTHLKHHYPKTS